MAKLYKKLQKALSSYKDRPESPITEQKLSESPFIIRGKDQGRPVWRYILVPVSKVTDLKAEASGGTIDCAKFGRLIEYSNSRGEIKRMSGWGKDPPKMIETWMNEHYNYASTDDDINLIYDKDDIRLCTMQRAIPQQRIGVHNYYHKQKRFHYIILDEELPLSLAYRAGIKTYDRVISFNGINTENDTHDQFLKRFRTERNLPVQMLVCSPATYAHYKSNNKLFHNDLPTIQHLQPVYATSDSNSNTDTPVVSIANDSFCAVQWENSSIVSTVPQSAIFKSPEFTRVNDVCFVKTEGQPAKGKIIFIGSHSDCEKFNIVSMLSMRDTITMNSKIDATIFKSASPVDIVNPLSVKKTSQKSDICTMQAQHTIQGTNDDSIPHIHEHVHTSLEQLPNELFLHIFSYIDIQYLYSGFWGLNTRLNNIFQSSQNLCLTFNEKTDQLSMKSYAPFIDRLIIDTSLNCDLSQFPNLKTLVLCDGNLEHQIQIQSEIILNLTYLSFLLGSEFKPSSSMIRDVFSNKFPFLRHVNLGRIDPLDSYSWSTSPCLQFVAIRSSTTTIVSNILASCPNLYHLQLHVLDNNCINVLSPPPSNHPLRRFTLWSDSVELTFEDVDTFLSYTPNVQHLYLQTVCDMPFFDLANGLVNRLNRLSRFDCHIKEIRTTGTRTANLTTLYQLHPCFNRLQCIKEDDKFRIYATK